MLNGATYANDSSNLKHHHRVQPAAFLLYSASFLLSPLLD